MLKNNSQLELPLGKTHETGTPETFVRALINSGVDFAALIKLDKKWVDRLSKTKYNNNMKIQTKSVHKINYNDLDRAIGEFLKKKGAKTSSFEIVAYEELSNYTSKEYSIGIHDWGTPSEDDKQDILNGELHGQTDAILEWMHEEGEIPSGDYVVKIFW